ncbi:BMP-2-inducible protein kinase [Homalodisca vitripennis]|nr:BMP-2-inducible protein kinase [Homalodisca vitripennis]
MLFTRQNTPKMKKLFSKIDNTAKEPNSYVGKAFTVGRMTVTVEDVLAEVRMAVWSKALLSGAGVSLGIVGLIPASDVRDFCSLVYTYGSHWSAVKLMGELTLN